MGNSAAEEALGITCWQASLAAALHIAAGQGRQAGRQLGQASKQEWRQATGIPAEATPSNYGLPSSGWRQASRHGLLGKGTCRNLPTAACIGPPDDGPNPDHSKKSHQHACHHNWQHAVVIRPVQLLAAAAAAAVGQRSGQGW